MLPQHDRRLRNELEVEAEHVVLCRLVYLDAGEWNENPYFMPVRHQRLEVKDAVVEADIASVPPRALGLPLEIILSRIGEYAVDPPLLAAVVTEPAVA